MKKLKFTALLGIIILLLSGCSKDIESILIGTWNIDKRTESITVYHLNLSETATYYNEGTIVFKSGGKGNWTEKDGTRNSFIWSVDGKKLDIVKEGSKTTLTLTTTEKNKLVGEWKWSDYNGNLKEVYSLRRK